MKANLGGSDRLVRLVIAGTFLYLFLVRFVTGLLAAAALADAATLTITVILGHSPVYSFFGISTRKNLNDKAHSYYKKPKSWVMKNTVFTNK